MPTKRNLDIATLRSFKAIAETGSMTRAASQRNMTQSAISMQIKRLEEGLDLKVFERKAKGMVTTASGDQLMRYAKNIISMNDEVLSRLTASEYEGKLSLGVPTDIINPYIPQILSRFLQDYPRIQVQLYSASSFELLEQFNKGMHDVLLTTEREPGVGGEVLNTQHLIWTGAVNGSAWKKSPVPLGFSKHCMFRKAALEYLDKADTDWIETVTAEGDSAGHAMVSVDLSIMAELEHVDHAGREVIQHGGQLPKLPDYSIVLYRAAEGSNPAMTDVLSEYITQAFS